MSRPPLDDHEIDLALRKLGTVVEDQPVMSVASILARAAVGVPVLSAEDQALDAALRQLGTTPVDLPRTPVPAILDRAGLPTLRASGRFPWAAVAASWVVGLGLGFGGGVQWAFSRPQAPAAVVTTEMAAPMAQPPSIALSPHAGPLDAPPPILGVDPRPGPTSMAPSGASFPASRTPRLQAEAAPGLRLAAQEAPWSGTGQVEATATGPDVSPLIAMNVPWGDPLEPRMRRAAVVEDRDPEPPFQGEGEAGGSDELVVRRRAVLGGSSSIRLGAPRPPGTFRAGLGVAGGLAAWGHALPPAGPSIWLQAVHLGTMAPLRPLAAFSGEASLLLGQPGVLPRGVFGIDGDLGAAAGNERVRAEIGGALAARLAPPTSADASPGEDGAGWFWLAGGPRFGVTVGGAESFHIDIAPLLSVVDHDGDGHLSVQPWLSLRAGIEFGERRPR